MSTREALRQATLGQSAQFKSKTVEFGGQTFEVREMSPGAKERVRKKSENQVITKKNGDQEFILDAAKYQAYNIIESVFVPGTNEKVFEDGDVKAILNSPSSGFYKVLGDAVSELAEDAVEEGNE